MNSNYLQFKNSKRNIMVSLKNNSIKTHRGWLEKIFWCYSVFLKR